MGSNTVKPIKVWKKIITNKMEEKHDNLEDMSEFTEVGFSVIFGGEKMPQIHSYLNYKCPKCGTKYGVEPECMEEKQKEKYYTPELSDFHIGYDYECSTFSGGIEEWDRVILNGGDFEEVDNIFARNEQVQKIRTPYLTKEQIEAEGWMQNDAHENTFTFNSDLICTFNPELHTIYIDDGAGCTLFDGEIKSINELRTLMKWLCIK